MPPIRKGDGTPVTPKGISQVRTGDGRILFDGVAIPDSVVAHWAADDLSSGFDEWVDRESGFVLDNFGSTYLEDGINGNPSVATDGLDDFLVNNNDIDLGSVDAEITFVSVFEPLSSDIGYIFHQADSATFGNQEFSLFWDGDLVLTLGGSENNLNGSQEPTIASATYSRPELSGTVGVNGAEIDANVGDIDRDEPYGFHVGARGDDENDPTATDVHFEGRIGDIIVAEGRSIDDYRQINEFLSNKYGIGLS